MIRVIKIKYLEIYSDLAKPLLTEFSFQGLSGGKLLYSASIEKIPQYQN